MAGSALAGATVAGATFVAFGNDDNDPVDEEQIVAPEQTEAATTEEQTEAATTEQQTEAVQPEQPQQPEQPEQPEQPQQPTVDDVDPGEVADRVIEQDQIDTPDDSGEWTAVGWREVVDENGEELSVMVFNDANGQTIALRESEPGSGLWDLAVNPDTGDGLWLSSSSFTRADFEDLLNDDGGYMPHDPNDPIFADNDDITGDIIVTDGGNMVAQNQQPASDDEPVADIYDDELSRDQLDGLSPESINQQPEDLIDLDELEDMLSQLLEDNGGQVNEETVTLVDDETLAENVDEDEDEDEGDEDEDEDEDEDLDDDMNTILNG